jgi:ABC-type multidrug transport system fused ATPase/permease subunit
MPLLDLLLAMFWLFLFIAWIWLVISVFIDIFRSRDLSGWSKALWVLFVLVVPLLGVLIYVIARGDKMHERQAQQLSDRNAATQNYIRDTAGSSGTTSDELSKMATLHDDGVITDDEFQAQKTKLLA